MTRRQTANKAISLEMHGRNFHRDMHAEQRLRVSLAWIRLVR